MLCLASIVCNLCILSGCTRKDYNAAEKLAVTFVEASCQQNRDIVNQCYGEDIVKQDVYDGANIRYRCFTVMKPKKIQIRGVETLYKSKEYSYIGISYDLKLDDGKTVPQYEYLLIKQKKETCRIILAADWPVEIRIGIEREREEMEETSLYTEYRKNKETFTEIFPDYLSEVYDKAEKSDISMENTGQAERVRKILGAVIGLTVIQIVILCLWEWIVRIIRIQEKRNLPTER